MGLFEEGRRGGAAKAATSLGLLYEQQGQTSKAMELYEESWQGGSAKRTHMSEACNVVVVTHDSGVSFVCHHRPQEMPSLLRRCPRLKEKSWQKAQAAPAASAALMKQAPDPSNLANHKGLRKLASDAKLISIMSLGKHGAQRTPVPALRAAIGRLEANSPFLPDQGRTFVKSVADGMLDHLGCVNTDKSFKPFAIDLFLLLRTA